MYKNSEVSEAPFDSELIETYFIEGSLGVTLKRRPNDGPIYVYALIENSQAIGKDIEINDEVWSAGTYCIGQKTQITKDDWDNLIEIIQKSKRPLRIVWRRKLKIIPSSPNYFSPKANREFDDTENNLITNDSNEVEVDPHLAELISRLKFSDKDLNGSHGKKRSSKELPKFLLKPNQKIIETSQIRVESTVSISGNNNNSVSSSAPAMPLNTLWNNLLTNTGILPTNQPNQKRFIILLTDTLLVSLPTGNNNNSEEDISSANSFQVEHIINLVTCKLSRIDNETSGNMNRDTNSQTSVPKQKFQNAATDVVKQSKVNFNITWSGGSLLFIFKTIEECDYWYKKILITATECSGYDLQYHQANVTVPVTLDSTRERSPTSIQTNNLMIPTTEENNDKTPTNINDNYQSYYGNKVNVKSIHEYVIKNQIKKLNMLFPSNGNSNSGNNNIDIDETNDDGYTPLHLACIFQYHDIIQLLYNNNANLCYADISEGFTPLHWSALLLDNKALQILLSSVIDPDMNDNYDRTPLLLLCGYANIFPHQSITSSMIGKITNRANNHIKTEDSNNGNNSDDSDGENVYKTIFSPFLSKKARNMLQKCIQILITRRANPDTADIDGITVIQYLAASWQYESIKLLIEAGAMVHVLRGSSSSHIGNNIDNNHNKNNKNNTKIIKNNALHFAVQGKRIKNTEYMELREHILSTILHMKTIYSSSSSSKQPSNPNSQMNDESNLNIQIPDEAIQTKSLFLQNNSNQYMNIKYGLHTVRVLLQSGSRPNGRNQSGKLPLQLLLKNHKHWHKSHIKQVIYLLIQYGARVDLLDSNEQNLLKTVYCSNQHSTVSGSSHNHKQQVKLGVGRTSKSFRKKTNKHDKSNHDRMSSSHPNTNIRDNKDESSDDDDNNENSDINDTDSSSDQSDIDNDDGNDTMCRNSFKISTSIAQEMEKQFYLTESSESMTFEKAIEIWTNKNVLQVDAIGLGLNSLKAEDEECCMTFPIEGYKEDSKSSNSGNVNICVLCSANFTLFKRTHHCRLCDVTCCDDCSKKRVVIANAKERVCDSCYNIAFTRLQENSIKNNKKSGVIFDPNLASGVVSLPLTTNSSHNSTGDSCDGSETVDRNRSNSGIYKLIQPMKNLHSGPVISSTTPPSNIEVSQSQSESRIYNSDGRNRALANTQPKAQPKSYANFQPKSSKINFIKVDESQTSSSSPKSDQKNTQGAVTDTISTMNEINQRLKERGEKLSNMADRTEELSQQASEFAKNAKELADRQKRKNSLFGGFF